MQFDRFFSILFRYVEKLVLIAIGGLALAAIVQLMLAIRVHGEVRLEDLLLMFIFVEIMAMANVYFVRRVVPFTYPMFIAITALSRLIVLQGKDIAPENLVFEGGAILLVSAAILIVRYSERYGATARGAGSEGEDPH